MTDLDTIARLAAGATTQGDGGHWTSDEDKVWAGPAVICRTFNGWRKPHDAAYIAAADPTTITALVRVVQAAQVFAAIRREPCNLPGCHACALRAALDKLKGLGA